MSLKYTILYIVYMKKRFRVIHKALLGVLLLPLVLFLILAGLLYVPAVQHWVVSEVTQRLSTSLAMDIHADRVRLSFPLDLDVRGVVALQEKDTVLVVDELHVDVPLLPLFSGVVNLDAFTLRNATVDTKQFLPDMHVRGTLGCLTAKSHGVDLRMESVVLEVLHLADTRLSIALGDTAAPDTTASAPVNWQLRMPHVSVERVVIALSLPNDAQRLFLNLQETALLKGNFDLGQGRYEFERLEIGKSALALGNPTSLDLPQHFTQFLTTSALQRDSLFAYHADSLSVVVDSLSYDATGTLLCGLRGLGLREQSGLRIQNLSGGVYMDSVQISLPAWTLTTFHSHLAASLHLPWSVLESRSTDDMRVAISGTIGNKDLENSMHLVDASSAVPLLPPAPLQLELVAHGNFEHLQLLKGHAVFQGIASLDVDGNVLHLLPDTSRTDIPPMGGDMTFHLGMQNMKPLLLRLGIADSTLHVPSGTTLHGRATFKGNDYQLAAKMKSLAGDADLVAATNVVSETYTASFLANAFPLSAFLPSMDASSFSGFLTVEGCKYDPTAPKALMDVRAQVDSLRLSGMDLNNLTLAANIAQQHLDACFTADNTALQGEGALKGNFIAGYHFNLNALLDRCSLQQLAGAAEDVAVGSMVDVEFDSDETFDSLQTKGSLRFNHFDTPERSVMMKDINFDFAASPDTTLSHLSAGNMTLTFGAKGHIAALSSQLSPMMDYLSACADSLRISHDTLRTLLPGVNLALYAGNDNPMTNILRAMGYSLDTLAVNLASYPQNGLSGDFMMKNFRYGDLQLDNATAILSHDNKGINLQGQILNTARRNPNKFALAFRSYLLEQSGGIDFQFKDAKGKTGFDVGLRADVTHEGVQGHIYPQQPKIAFRTFKVNPDNFIFIGNDKSLQANVRLQADDGTGLQLFSESADSLNDITLNIQNLNLKELSNVLPYMPRMGGFFNADVHITDDRETISAMSSITTQGLEYEGTTLGNIGADLVYLPKSEGEHYASAFISVDGTDVMECNGTYVDTEEGFFEGDALLNGLPLALVNGFLVGTDVNLKGNVQGEVHIDGTLTAPRVNGEVYFADAHIFSPVYGFDFKMDEKPIVFQDSRLLLEGYQLTSSGNNPMTVNGEVDMSDLDNMRLDIAMKAKNFELINAKRKLNSIVYGKAYVDFDCSVRGDLNRIVVRGDLDVLNRTNLSYVLKDSPLTVDDQLEGLVEFVSFEDTTTVVPQSLPATNMDLTLNLGISDAANFYCALSEDGKSYVDVQGGGDLTLRLTQQGEMRLMGRLVIEDGAMKYTLPIIPLKTFKLTRGSYVEFTGNVMNPTLSIQAKERMKSVVTENEQQRSVAFDVGVAISKTLENMGLEFTVEAPEDMGIQNQLTAMTPAQRSKVAVSLMATGLFLADGTGAKGGMQAGSALNAFLQSEIQNIAGSALKTIDINFGIENSTTQEGAKTTDYSFQFSKRFFNDRFAVNIGGKVSTGHTTNNDAASFIDNITLEYRLDKGATRYVQIFYDRSSFDPLEGQLTKMGTGVVLRKKTDKLGELFLFR